ncbi:uncharacterized protein Ice1 [Haematobia irritans]|uniref:uncharacterized protein Ice1 n=1 Tax=Haematobia irritans TaxID=7368 RepID=UPI003F503493
MCDFDFGDLNLDFLQSTPPKATSVKKETPVVSKSRKRLDLAKRVAKADELLKEIQKLKCDNQQLHSQLKDFQKTALDIQVLYTTEKRNLEEKTKALQELENKYEKADADLTSKLLECEQLESSLADLKECPVKYNDLVVKYLRLFQRTEGEDVVKNVQDRSMVEELKQYCAKLNIKYNVPGCNSPKNPTLSRTKSQKIRREEVAIQCELLKEQTVTRDNVSKISQGTQCQVELRTQGTQHISTMTTRGTTTTCFIKFRSIGTNFPEAQTQTAVNDILKEFVPWQNIMPISPLIDLPQPAENIRTNVKTIGTCTWLCNIRRPIDFVPRKAKRYANTPISSNTITNQGIKQEIPTPSPSPIPNNETESNNSPASTNVPITNTVPMPNMPRNNPLLTSLNASSQLNQIEMPTFHELWHIFGRMILGLLHTSSSSNAGISASSSITQDIVNQRQFHSWLRELYDSSVAATNANVQSSHATSHETLDNQSSLQMNQGNSCDTRNIATSPSRFQESSLLTSTHIARPQARRTCIGDISDSYGSNSESIQEPDLEELETRYELSDTIREEDTAVENNTSQNSSSELYTSRSEIRETSNDNKNSINMPMEGDIKNEFQYIVKASKERKRNQREILNSIKEMFEGVKLSKDKKKALKRLLKSKKSKKKSSKDKNMENCKAIENCVITKKNEEEKEIPTETAVDFLKSVFDIDCRSNDNVNEIMAINKQETGCPSSEEYLQRPKELKDFCRYLSHLEVRDEENQNTAHDEYPAHNHCVNISGSTSPDITTNRNEAHIRAEHSYFKENFSFAIPAEVLKPTKSSNKKELYSSLFGDSDTENDEDETNVNEIKVGYEVITNDVEINSAPNQISAPSTHINHFDVELSQCGDITARVYDSQYNNCDRDKTIKENDITHRNQYDQIRNIYHPPQIDVQSIQNISMNFNETPMKENDSNTVYSSSMKDQYSIPEIPTPILRNAEMHLMKKSQGLIIFENYDSENQKRLETIIDQHLEQDLIMCNEMQDDDDINGFNTDLEKEFELSSEDAVVEENEIRYVDEQLPNQSSHSVNNELGVGDSLVFKQATNNSVQYMSFPMSKSCVLPNLSQHETQNIYVEEQIMGNAASNVYFDKSAMPNSCSPDDVIKYSLHNQHNIHGSDNQREIDHNVQLNNPISKVEKIRNSQKDNETSELRKFRKKSNCFGKHDTESETKFPFSRITEILNKNGCTSQDEFIPSIPEVNTSNHINIQNPTKLPTLDLATKENNPLLPSEKVESTKEQIYSDTETELSIIEISSTIMETEKTLDITSPCSELMIDEDISNKSSEEEKQNRGDINTIGKTQVTNLQNISNGIHLPHEYVKAQNNTTKSKENCEGDNLNSCDISSILNSTMCKDILTDSMNPIIDEILYNADEILLSSNGEQEKKISSIGRKRKAEHEAEILQPVCKRSERIRAKKLILDESTKISISPVEIGKYTRVDRNKMKVEATRVANKKNEKSHEIKASTNMGFFREIGEHETMKEREITKNEEITGFAKNVYTLSEAPPVIRIECNASQNDSPHWTEGKRTVCEKPNENITDSTHVADNNTPKNVNNIEMGYNNPFDNTESPQSPQNCIEEEVKEDTVQKLLNTATFEIPLELSPSYRPNQANSSLLESLICNYSPQQHKRIVNSQSGNFSKNQISLLQNYKYDLTNYCNYPMAMDPDIMASKQIAKLKQSNIDYELFCTSMLHTAKESEPSPVEERHLPSFIQEMPPRHLSQTLQRLFYLLKHLMVLNVDASSILVEKIESQLFASQHADKNNLNACIHLTQLYLIACKFLEPQIKQHPARLFIAKCLYHYSINATPMVHEVLMWYPTTLPPKEDSTYDCSNALITVIQHCLMCTRYDMEDAELRGKILISKLRYEYHYLVYSPTFEDVAINLVEKVKNSKFQDDITFSFGLFCKRLLPTKVETVVLQPYLLPLANEYFNEALISTDYDLRISVLLEIISFIIKPFPIAWNIEVYMNLFSRFLNAFPRKIIQEAAVCSILRLQRFGFVNCFNRLRCFKPNYDLEPHTQAMFKTFIHRKKLEFLKTIQSQNPKNI